MRTFGSRNLHASMTALTRALLVVVCATALWSSALAGQAAADPIVVYLARHAERAEDGTDDPPISAEGEARARLLAAMLRDGGLTHIHTTDTRRTRATAAPTGTDVDVALTLYDADELDALAALIRRSPGRHLVVGHSNTLRETVSALGGEPGDTIEQDEYDRLYVLTLTGDGTSTVLLRFGHEYPATPR